MPMQFQQSDVIKEALLHYKNGDFEKVSSLCHKYLEINPFSIEVINLKAIAERRLGNINCAISLLHTALVIDPSLFDVILNLADILECAGRYEDATDVYCRAQTINPAHLRVLGALARLFEARGMSDMAATVYCRLAILAPELPQVEYRLGVAAYHDCRFQGARVHLSRAIRLMPESAILSHAFSLTLMADGHNAVIPFLRRTICLDPGMADAWGAIGSKFYQESCFYEEEKAYRRVSVLCPDDISARKRIAFSAIRSGNIEGCWNIRLELPGSNFRVPNNILQIPAWSGQSGAHLHVLVIGREGVGDEIFFAACLPDLIARVGRITLACTSRLVRLFRRSFPTITVVSHAKMEDNTNFRVYIDELPLYFRKKPADLPHRVRYLVANITERRCWRALFTVEPGTMVIGLAWHTVASAKRSVSLHAMIAALVGSGATLVNLQYGNYDEAFAVATHTAGLTAIYGLNVGLASDFDRWSAQIAACDLVITIDSAIAHLAGALGVPTWVLLPVENDVRWELDRYASPWYPSIRLFQQMELGSWQNVFDQIRTALMGGMLRP